MPYDNQYYHGRDPGSIARFHHGVFSILARALPEDGRYLDLGAGTGLLASWLASQKKADVTAVEVSEFACATIRQRYPNVKTVVADLDRELPVDGPFDVVTMIHCLEHIRDPAGILRRIRAVLAPTGVFICVVPNCGPTLVRAMGHPK